MIIILVTELEALLEEASGLPSTVRHILARAQTRDLNPSAMPVSVLAGEELPIAPLTRHADRPDDAQGAWLRADPVGLVPDLNAVWLRPDARLEADSAAADELRKLFAEEGLEFDLVAGDRGYLRLDQAPQCHFVPPWLVAGQSLDHVQPSGPGARRWQRLMSECQVVLHQYRNEQADEHFPGGLWLWGGGELPARGTLNPPVCRVFGSDPVLKAAAGWLALAQEPGLPGHIPDSACLVEWPVDHAVGAADNLARLADWLKPLLWRLKLGRLERLELAGRQRAWSLTARSAWRFWRRSGRAR